MGLTPPTTTRAAVYHSPGDIRIERVPLRTPRSGEALVRIRACGLCGSETMAWYMARRAPHPLGHEPVAEVVAPGDGVSLRPGQRVFVHHHAPCMRCRTCLRGNYVHCSTFRSTRLVPGSLSEFALVPEEIVAADVLPIPDGIGDDAAVFVEPLACVVKGLHKVRFTPDARIVVVGLGVMGLLHVLLARRVGAERVIGIDVAPSRLAAGRTAGADAVLDSQNGDAVDAVREATGGGGDVVVVTPGSPEAITVGLAFAAPAARLLLFTPMPPDAAWAMPVHDIFFREVEIIPTYSAGPHETREALGLLEQGLPVDQLVTHRLGLDQVTEGYRLMTAGKALKVIIRPSN